MKGRESGMPDAGYWETFFDAAGILKALVPDAIQGAMVEFGSGYGTFTLPCSRMFTGPVIGIDIEADLVEHLRGTADGEGRSNLRVEMRDFAALGTGLLDGSIAHALLYNILHIENPVDMLAEAFRILTPRGTISIIHWRSDIPTPRGPSLAIRPTLEKCVGWALDAGFVEPEIIDISASAPYHFGARFAKPMGRRQETT